MAILRTQRNFQYLARVLDAESKDWYLVSGKLSADKVNEGLTKTGQPTPKEIVQVDIEMLRARRQDSVRRSNEQTRQRMAKVRKARCKVTLQRNPYYLPLAHPCTLNRQNKWPLCWMIGAI